MTSNTRNSTRRNIFTPRVRPNNGHRNSRLKRGMIRVTLLGVLGAVSSRGTRSHCQRRVTRMLRRLKRLLFTPGRNGKGRTNNGNANTDRRRRSRRVNINRLTTLHSKSGGKHPTSDATAIDAERKDEGLSTPGVDEREVPTRDPETPVGPTQPF